MNHSPNPLALLISLIGVGVSPAVQARVDEPRVGAPVSLPGVNCTEAAAALLPACGEGLGLSWQPSYGAIHGVGPGSLRRATPPQTQALALADAPGVLAEPGVDVDEPTVERVEVIPVTDAATASARFDRMMASLVAVLTDAPLPAAPATAEPTVARAVPRTATPPAARESPRLAVGNREGPTRTAHVLDSAPRAPAEPMAKVNAPMVAPMVAPPAAPTVVPVARAAVDPVGDVPTPAARGDRPMDSLAAVSSDAPAPAATPAAAALPSQATAAQASACAGEPCAVQAGPAKTVVESQSNMVLRNLQAILSDERDEVGAIRTDAMPAPVTSHSAQVMATLGEISSARQPVEDGPTRRLRKLAARAANAQASAEAARRNEVRAADRETEANGVDVLLPLELLPIASVPTEPFVPAPRLSVELPAVPAVAQAEQPDRPSPFGDQQVAVSDTSLGSVRGGFSGNGLNISFGIERAVYVNGALVTTTSLNFGDLGQITAGRGATSLDAGTIQLIQNGVGNSVATGSISPTSIGTVIQNTLDGQKIQNMTVINATVNSLGLLRSMNLGASLRGAVIDSLRR